ncbi:unnamed protein product [Cylindrotheca closterium]|uniref:SET domain-containing protein n=1 Tax=Cylindrotheca closterium TaxID=2856 RepID=A0AAD2CTJ7_9STRA|nr:unnamed protein product [Cylindrotheca closterium]
MRGRRLNSLLLLPLIVQVSASQHAIEQEETCGLWLAESTAVKNSLGLFAGVKVRKGEDVLKNGGELHIPIYDKNPREWSKLHDVWWTHGISLDFALQSDFHSYSFLPGVGVTATCHDGKANIKLFPTEEMDTSGVHRHKDATAGSFTYRLHSEYVASENIAAGQELLLDCRESSTDEEPTKENELFATFKSSDALCVDTLAIQSSTVAGAGRGAFAKRSVKEGERVAVSPVIAFDESEMYMFEQAFEDDYLTFQDKVLGYQLLYNYCYGHQNSSMLLLPTGPGVNAINHDSEKANVALRWSNSTLNGDAEFLKTHYAKLTGRQDVNMILEYIALEDIDAGNEIFLDYGESWEKSFESFVEDEWEPPPFSNKYRSAADFNKQRGDLPFRTVSEQRDKRYPRNIITTCLFRETEESFEQDPVTWTMANNGCLRPCRILERHYVGDGEYLYKAEAQKMPNKVEDPFCQLSKTHRMVQDIPSEAIMLTDRMYTTDDHMMDTFRNFIEAPNGLFPNSWMRDNEDMGELLQPKLKTLQIEPIRWESTGEAVTENAYMVKMPISVRKGLLEYCKDVGITKYFRDLTFRGNSLEAGDEEDVVLDGLKWHVHRPPEEWRSDMHWMSPFNEKAHLDYLQELGMAGFDDVLQSIGEYFGMDRLAVYHMSFIGVSYCSDDFIHRDISGSGGKVFNVIIPLILADETGPELGIAANTEGGPIGRLRLQKNVGIMLGDDAFHGTAAVDYRAFREMRLAATVYIGESNEENIDNIMKHYAQHYAQSGNQSIHQKTARTHWKKGDPGVRLPEYHEPHDEL